ncbi:uncharacterized protein BXZ73DRAFT_49827, partial [Epithele typhae]|uniref:uncharacterized protein n=1 Tax=Epithele typhae TaxID=378194 RepID=UPI00200774B7
MATSETKYDLDANGKQKIDGALYLDQYTPEDGRPHWPDQVVPIEFKRGRNSLDPFDDKKDGGTTQAETRKVVRGQVANYVETLLDYQYRTFTFFLFFFGRTVRLTRWSRAGVIVSHAFDYVDKWDTLCEALRRISHLTRVDSGQGVGYDPTSTRLRSKDPEWKVMTNAAKARSTDVDLTERDLADGELVGAFTFKYVRDMFAESLQQDAARYKLAIPDGNGGFRYFLVARRQFRGPGAIGRGTCGLVGYEKKTRRFYWIKDTWRADYPALMREGDVLEELRLAGVPNIPTLVCHGDLPGQATVEHTLWKKRQEGGPDVDPTCPFRRHQHYRLCVEEVGLPLHRFTSVYQFLNIVLNAVQAHSVAFRKCDILHRDVSGGNILIFPRVVVDKPDGGSETRRLLWKGALIDWELAKKITEKFWRQPGRTGTMQFMSIAILMDGNKVATVSDDMESFFYIILYYSVRYVDSNITEDAQVFSWLERFFDCYTLDGDIYTCGEVK